MVATNHYLAPKAILGWILASAITGGAGLGCSSKDSKGQQKKEITQFHRNLASVNQEIHKCSKDILEITTEVSSCVAAGKSFDKDAVERAYAAQLKTFESLRAYLQKFKVPAGETAQNLYDAMVQGVENEEKRLRVNIREWLDIYEDQKLSPAEKKTKGNAIRERVAAERNADEAAIKTARQAFMKEWE